VNVAEACTRSGHKAYWLDGAHNELKEWQESTEGGVLIVQIQAGAEGIDLTKASRGVYYSLPYSLALYEQSLARLYRPGQTKDVQFTYLLAEDTIDESIYTCLQNKKDLITEVQQGTIDFSYLKK
jgi:SNF2 family DNA or RNA helicase